MNEQIKIVKRIESKISRASGLLHEAQMLAALNEIDLGVADRLTTTSSASVGLLRLVEIKRREMESESRK